MAPMHATLFPHPATPPHAVTQVQCEVRRDGAGLALTYRITAAPRALVVPPPAAPARTDGLWRTTCAELFVAGIDGGYIEFNFAPSGQWAAYRFTGRRDGMAPLDLNAPPSIRARGEGDALIVAVSLPEIEASAGRLGITAVIEEVDGTTSYWALRHGGGAPDFHDPDCFVLQLPPAD
jgi:hypothetical protein